MTMSAPEEGMLFEGEERIARAFSSGEEDDEEEDDDDGGGGMKPVTLPPGIQDVAKATRWGWMSTMTMAPAPNARATAQHKRPTGPAPKTTSVSPGVTRACLTI